MKHNGIYILLVVAFFICLNCSKNSKEEIKVINGKTFQLDKSPVHVFIPYSFKKTSQQEIKKNLANAKFENQLKVNQFNNILKVIDSKSEFNIFMDSINIGNYIFIKNSDITLELNRGMLNDVANSFLTQNENEQNKSQLIEKEYVSKEKFRYVKLKTRRESNEAIEFFTHYLIASKYYTTLITTYSPEDIEYQNYIDRIKIIN